MVRFSNKFLAVIAATAIIAMAAQIAVAQNERPRGRGGRGGGPGGMMGGPPGMIQLLRDEHVQQALKLTDDQKSKLKTIANDMVEEVKKEMQDGGRPDPEKMRKLRDGATAKVNEVLDAGQQKRLMGIFVQVAGAGAAMDPSVAKELKLTDEQKDKLHEAMGPPPGGRGEGRGEGKGEAKGEGRGEGRGAGGGAAFKERREKMEKEMMAVLTSDQQKQLEEMKGEKVDVDMSKLRGPGGGGREGRGRGRDRGEPKESKSS